MKLKFDRAELAALVAALPAADSKLTLVKDDGIYLMSFAIPMPTGAKSRHVVYARGFNPKTDGDIWQKCVDAVGGDDFGETVGVKSDFVNTLEMSEGDIILNITATHISTSYLPKMTEAQKATRIKTLQDWLGKTTAVAETKWSPKFKKTVAKAKKELAALGAN